VSEHPECEKLSSAQPEYGAILEFLEWMGGLGIHRMVWAQRTNTQTCVGSTWDFNATCREGRRVLIDTGKDTGPCGSCRGTGEVTTTHEGWETFGGSPEDLVQKYFGIDPVKLEQERSAMLRALQGREDGS